jgi:ATP-dependent HslUV protease ATP-binding subunit HslU
MAELQGRLPIRVELAALTEEELYRILTETENNLCQQQVELLAVDKVDLRWQDDAKREIARVACEVNRSVENIGARRLATVIERIVDDLSYSASDVPPGTAYVIDAAFVRAKVAPMLKTADLRKFIL